MLFGCAFAWLAVVSDWLIQLRSCRCVTVLACCYGVVDDANAWVMFWCLWLQATRNSSDNIFLCTLTGIISACCWYFCAIRWQPVMMHIAVFWVHCELFQLESASCTTRWVPRSSMCRWKLFFILSPVAAMPESDFIALFYDFRLSLRVFACTLNVSNDGSNVSPKISEYATVGKQMLFILISISMFTSFVQCGEQDGCWFFHW